jgi:hypothetical protein
MIDPNYFSPSGKRVTLPEDDLRARGNAQRRVLVPPKAVLQALLRRFHVLQTL